MLNNFTYILKALRRTSLLSVVILRLPDIEKSYLELVRQHKVHYRQVWSRVLHYISENQQPCSTTSIPADAKLKDKDRNLIKEKFMGFNREIEEIHRIQKAFAIPDAELRETLRNDNKQFVLPFYRNFLIRHRNAPFTRHPAKYIKYSEKDVEKFIDDFFDATS
jgi:exocyst complex protein 7